MVDFVVRTRVDTTQSSRNLNNFNRNITNTARTTERSQRTINRTSNVIRSLGTTASTAGATVSRSLTSGLGSATTASSSLRTTISSTLPPIARLTANTRALATSLTGSLATGFNSASAGAGRFTAAIGSATLATRGLLTSIGLLPPVIIGVAGTAVIRAFSSFEAEMSNVRAISGATEAEFISLTNVAEELGRTTRFSATEAAEGLTFLARAGFDVNEQLEALPAVLTLAQAGGLGLGSAADIVSNVLQGFGEETSQVTRFVDVLSSAANSSNTSVEQLGMALSFVGPPARSLGVSVEETAAAIGVLSDAGIQGSRAGTGLRRVLSALADPTEELQDVLNEAGLRVSDLDISTQGLIPVLQRLANANLTTGQTFRGFGIQGASVADVLAVSVNRIQELTRSLRMSDGQAEETSRIIDDNLSGSFTRFTSALTGAAIELGRLFSPPIRIALDGLAAYFVGFAETISLVRMALAGYYNFLSRATSSIVTELRPHFETLHGFFNFGENIDNSIETISSFYTDIRNRTTELIGFLDRAFRTPTPDDIDMATGQPAISSVSDDIFNRTLAGFAPTNAPLVVPRNQQAIEDLQPSAPLPATENLPPSAPDMGGFIPLFGGDLGLNSLAENQEFFEFAAQVEDALAGVRDSFRSTTDEISNTGVADDASRVFGSLADITRGFVGEQSTAYQALFAIQQGAALSSALLSIQEGEANSLSAGFPENLGNLAAFLGQTAGILAAIQGTQYQGAQYEGGFQTGGNFMVGGSGGPDSQRVAFDATPGERVTIETPDQQSQSGAVQIINVLDPRVIDQYLSSPAGVRRVLNVINDNGNLIRNTAR